MAPAPPPVARLPRRPLESATTSSRPAARSSPASGTSRSHTTTTTTQKSANDKEKQQPVEGAPLKPAPGSVVEDYFALEDRFLLGDDRDGVQKHEKLHAQVAARLLEDVERAVAGGEEVTDAQLARWTAAAARLRQQVRAAALAVKCTRDRTSEKMSEAEQRFLQLNNTTCEIQHLRAEIARCYEFRSADEDLDLVDVDEFYARAPDSISKPDETRNDAHAQQIARIEWERSERNNLLSTLGVSEGRRQVLISDIQGKKQKLRNMCDKYRQIRKAAKPLQDLVGVVVAKKKPKTEDEAESLDDEWVEQREEEDGDNLTAAEEEEDEPEEGELVRPGRQQQPQQQQQQPKEEGEEEPVIEDQTATEEDEEDVKKMEEDEEPELKDSGV